MAEDQKPGSETSRRRRRNGGSGSGSGSSGRSRRHSSSESSSGEGGKSRSSSSRASAYYKCKRQNTLLKSILFLLVILVIGAGLMSQAYINKAKTDLVNKQYELDQLAAKHAVEDREFERIKAQMATLVKGRVPDLNPVVFDKVIAVEVKYVKSMLLTVAGTGEKKRHEYNLNLENKMRNIVQPRIKIYLFDRTGLQIGVADLKHIKDEVLVPGEKRTYHGAFDIRMSDREPAYYIVEARAN